MLKIGVVFDKSPAAGGGYQAELAVVKSLAQYGKGFKFIIFTRKRDTGVLPSPSETLSYAFVDFNSKIFRLRDLVSRTLWSLSFELFFSFWSKRDPLNRLFAEHEIDLVLYLGPHQTAPRTLKPYIITVWDLQHRLQNEFPEVSSGALWYRRENYYKSAIQRAFATIADSEVGANHISRFYHAPADKVFALPFIHNLDDLPIVERNQLPNQSGFDFSLKFFFYPAMFWPHKNHIVLIEALKILFDRGLKDIGLVFTGSNKGNAKFLADNAESLGLGQSVVNAGFVSEQDVAAYYRSARALVMPTFFGPTNIPVYEAFYFGCPVIASDIEGIREQISEDGLLADPLDPNSWADAMERMLDDETYENYKSRGLRRTRQHTKQNYYQKLSRILELYSAKRRCWP